MRALVCLLGALAVCLSSAANSEEGQYDPSRDKGFRLSEQEFLSKLNGDPLIRALHVEVKVTSRELADDRKRDVVDYGFGGCPGALGSVDHKTRNVLSFELTATPDCMSARLQRFLFASNAVLQSLGAASSLQQASQMMSEALQKMKADTSETKSGIVSANGRTVQIISPPSGRGLIVKVYPTATNDTDVSGPVSQVTADGEMKAQGGQPFCTEKDKLQEFLLALLKHDDRWVRELKESCMGLPEGARMALIEDYPSDSEIGHVSKVRVFAPGKGSMVGYTLVISPK